jgi:hypothetical protein
MTEWGYVCRIILTQALRGVSCQLHAPASLSLGKERSSLIVEEVRWATVRLNAVEIEPQFLGRSIHSLIPVPTEV